MKATGDSISKPRTLLQIITDTTPVIITFSHQRESGPKTIRTPSNFLLQRKSDEEKKQKKQEFVIFHGLGSFKDYVHVRSSTFRWWKDMRFNQVNATTWPPLCVQTSPMYTCVSTHVRTRERCRVTFMDVTRFGNGATACQPEVEPPTASCEHVSRRLLRRKIPRQSRTLFFTVS